METVGLTEVIFDTGTSIIIGDPIGIERFYRPLYFYGARSAPEYGDGTYTGTWASMAADQTLHRFNLSVTVPCNFSTPISVHFGGKEVKISPDSFNLGPVTKGSDTCYAGAASNDGLIG